MESWADAFNRADCADAIRLAPGATRRFRCGVEFETA
jgi:aldose 1-epimerase